MLKFSGFLAQSLGNTEARDRIMFQLPPKAIMNVRAMASEFSILFDSVTSCAYYFYGLVCFPC